MPESQMVVEPDGRTDARANVRVSPAIFFLPLVVTVIFRYLVWPLEFSLPQVLGGSTTRVVVGLLVSIIGFAIQGITIAEFRKTDQQPDFAQPTTSVIRSGPYRYSRNPMYLGAVLIHLGVGIGIGSIWVLLTLIVAVAMAHVLAIVPEERYLEQKFGDEYCVYKATTRRWL